MDRNTMKALNLAFDEGKRHSLVIRTVNKRIAGG